VSAGWPASGKLTFGLDNERSRRIFDEAFAGVRFYVP
jgi:hypothetical protein